jgi:hypothetical protein
MNPAPEADAPDLAGWVVWAAAVQGLALDGELLGEVVAFVAMAQDMVLALPGEGDEP